MSFVSVSEYLCLGLLTPPHPRPHPLPPKTSLSVSVQTSAINYKVAILFLSSFWVLAFLFFYFVHFLCANNFDLFLRPRSFFARLGPRALPRFRSRTFWWWQAEFIYIKLSIKKGNGSSGPDWEYLCIYLYIYNYCTCVFGGVVFWGSFRLPLACPSRYINFQVINYKRKWPTLQVARWVNSNSQNKYFKII